MTVGVLWKLASGTSTGGTPQTNPNAALSGKRSSTEVQELSSTLTSVTALPRIAFVDTTQIGASIDHTGKWLSFQSGANNEVAREIAAFDNTTGTFTLRTALAADAATSDPYRIWPTNGLFSSFSNDQSVAEVSKVRLIYIENTTGSSMNPFRLWVNDIDPGPLVCEVAMGSVNGAEQTVLGVTNEELDPALGRTPDNFNQGIDRRERWARAMNWTEAEWTTPSGLTQVANNAFHPIFVRLRFQPGEPMPLYHKCVFQIFGDHNNGTRLGSVVIVVEVLGPDEEITAGSDRLLRLRGGARIRAIIRHRATGAPVPGKTVSITQTAGPGTLGVQSSELSDDSGNPVRATYLSPTDSVNIGDTVSFRLEVN